MIPAAILSVIVQAKGVTDANKAIGAVDVKLSEAERSAVKATREIEQFGRTSATAKVDVDASSGHREVESLRREIAGLSDKTVTVRTRTSGDSGGDGGASAQMRRTAESANILQRTIALVKPAALIAGLGFVAQAASAAAAGALALVASLAPLAGVMAAYPAMLAAFAQGMGVAKLAMMGMGKVGEDLKKALDAPTPAANAFKKTIDSLTPQIVHLRDLAQKPILEGLSTGIKSASSNFSRLNPIVAGTGRVLGGLAAEAGKLVGSSAFGKDISLVGARNTKILDILGHAALHIADALRHVIVAAGPLTMWLARLAAGWATNIDAAAKAGRETGKMRDFFESTRAVIERLLSIAGNLGSAFWNIAKGGKALGDELLKSLDKTTESFAKWTKSAEGQNKIKAFFDNAKPAIYEVAKLVRDVAKGFAGLSQQPGLANLIHQFRTELLPILLRVLNSTTQAFGPHLIAMITAFAQAFEPLAGSSGPLVAYVDVLTGIAQAAAWLVQNVPGAGAAITFLVGTLVVMKAANFGASILGIKKAMELLKSETVATTAAAVLQKAAMLAQAAASGIATAAMWLFDAAMAANPIGLVIVAIAALIAIFLLLTGNLSVLTGAFSAAWGWLKQATVDTWGFIKTVIAAVWNWLIAVAGSTLSGLLGLVTAAWGAIKAVTSAVWGAIKAFLGAIWDGIRTAVTAAVGAVRTVVGGAWDAIASVTSTVWNAVKSVVVGVASAIGGAVRDTVGALRDWLSEAWGSIRDRARDVWDAVKNAITGAVKGAFSAVKDVVGSFVDIGGDIIRGIVKGVRDAASSVADAVGDVVTGAIDKAKHLLHIGSPSRVFVEIGQQTGAGFVAGVAGMVQAAQAAVARLVEAPAPAPGRIGGPLPAAAGATSSPVAAGPLIVQNIDRYVVGERDDSAVAARLAWLLDSA